MRNVIVLILANIFSYSTFAQDRIIDFDYKNSQAVWNTGTVIKITDDTITMRSIKNEKDEFEFLFHDRLKAGEFNKLASDAFAYRKKDVLKGDIVTVHVISDNKILYCATISICERPNGFVPESQLPRDFQAHHDLANAFVANRDKGIPIPLHLLPGAKKRDFPDFVRKSPKLEER